MIDKIHVKKVYPIPYYNLVNNSRDVLTISIKFDREID